MSETLDQYLRMERDVETAGEAEAEEVRSAMDSVWMKLTEKDREFLDSRG